MQSYDTFISFETTVFRRSFAPQAKDTALHATPIVFVHSLSLSFSHFYLFTLILPHIHALLPPLLRRRFTDVLVVLS